MLQEQTKSPLLKTEWHGSEEKKTKDGIMVWIHLLSHKKSVLDSMHFIVAQQQRLSDGMKSSRWPGWVVPERFLPAGLPPCHTTHPTPRAGGEGGEEGGKRGGESGTEDLTGASDPST